MKGSVIASGAVHLVVMLVLFLVRPPATLIVPGPDVVQVSLLDSPAMPVIAPVTPAPRPKPEPVAVQPTEDSGVKLEPVKPRPNRKPEPEREAPPAPPAPALPYASVGSSGLRGSVSLDTNFEFTYYLTLVRNRIAQSWSPPAGLTSGGKPVEAVVYFRIVRDGGIGSLRLETTSGYEFFDRSAVRAIQLSDPLPPLPLGYSGGDLGVHFGFQFLAP
jgi:TonB family protein